MGKYCVAYAFDENYMRHACASMMSLVKNNPEAEQIEFYLMISNIPNDQCKILEQCFEKNKNIHIHWIQIDQQLESLQLDMEWNIAKSAYARLFMEELLPSDVKNILYLDCDTIIINNIEELFEEKKESYAAGVLDVVSDHVKEAIGLKKEENYYNSGVMMFYMEKIREHQIQKKFLELIEKNNGNVFHHDQGVINAVLKNHIDTLPLKYDVMTINYKLSYNNILKYYNYHGEYYSKEEVQKASKYPTILHFTPSFTERPWVEGCNHPMREEYEKYLAMTPWKNQIKLKNKTSWKQKVINSLFDILPQNLFISLIRKIS